MSPIDIIDKYYKRDSPLYVTLSVHSLMVRDKALECVHRNRLDVDIDFIAEAAMLHDVGIFRCDAPSIYCTGELPYICHGVEGRKILEIENLPRHALVCERHTGTGLTKEDILSQNLPIPCRDMLPVSLEEKLICYADKFYSKSGDLKKEKSIEQVISSMAKHGDAVLQRFLELHMLFG